MTVTLAELTPNSAAKLMAAYAKHFHAGAFATPLAKEINPRELWTWRDDSEATVAIIKRSDRPLRRKDWTGREYTLPAHVPVVHHLARTPNGPLPMFLAEQPYLFTYVEDSRLTNWLWDLGKRPVATRISAASEIIRCWGPTEADHTELLADQVTAARLPGRWHPPIPMSTRAQVLGELHAVHQWHDDYPYYSDGTWSAVSLRGFYPDQPHLGTKPAEMPRKWQAEHPGCNDLRCEWTTLSEQLPALSGLVRSIPWINGLERVRLMRMQGRRGRPGHLGRHSDVTDRNAGTRTGNIARFHLPIVSNRRITMTVWELDGTERCVNLEPWSLWYLDARKPHAVDNPTSIDRVHLVIDAIVDPAVNQLLASLAG